MNKRLTLEFDDRISSLTYFLKEYDEDENILEVFGWIKRIEIVIDSVYKKPKFNITFPHLKRCSAGLKYKLGLAAIKLSKWGVRIKWN